MAKTKDQINAERAQYREVLKIHGYTLTDAAPRLGVTLSGLSAMLTRGVSTGLAARTAAALNIDIKELQPRNEPARQTDAPTAKKRLSFPFQCANCGQIHTITIEID